MAVYIDFGCGIATQGEHFMKNTNKCLAMLRIAGIIALAAVIGFGAVACKTDDEQLTGGGGLVGKEYTRAGGAGSLEFTSASSVIYHRFNAGPGQDFSGTYVVDSGDVTCTFDYDGGLKWILGIANNYDTLHASTCTGSIRPSLHTVFVNKAADISAFVGTWTAGNKTLVFKADNTFEYKENDAIKVTGEFIAANGNIFIKYTSLTDGSYGTYSPTIVTSSTTQIEISSLSTGGFTIGGSLTAYVRQ
jgi:hypothetical protein